MEKYFTFVFIENDFNMDFKNVDTRNLFGWPEEKFF